MGEKKNMIAELVDVAVKLPEHEQQKLVWMGQGILFANDSKK